MAAVPLLKLRDISKQFPGVLALDGVNFDVLPGEVHALVGENGAGKSTLVHILAGVLRPDRGDIEFDGWAGVVFHDELAAQQLGLATVFQERTLFKPLSVAENIFAGRQPTSFMGIVSRATMRDRSIQLLDEVGLHDVDPSTPVAALSPHEQQLIEIAKALSLRAKLIIFDEPTAALTETETDALFAIVKRLRAQGRSIIYITHRLEEIFQLADRVTVFKDGKWQGTVRVDETTPQELVRLMVGRDLVGGVRTRPHSTEEVGTLPPVLEVRNLSDGDQVRGDRVQLTGVSFSVRRGEIVALAGLAGAGRTETALAVFGARPSARGEVFVGGRPARIRHIRDAIRAGLGYLPEDRKEAGLFLEMSISANIAAASLRPFGRFFLNDRRMASTAIGYCKQLNIASRGPHQKVVSLSGGNQQKVLMAKWLLVRPKVLIVDEPTRGVDVGAKAEVHRLLVELSLGGTAIVLISSDLPEVMALADRILVMAGGRIAGELSRGEASEERVIQLASQVEAAANA
jgi:ABC-type sugar transport system ATPase subunit